MRRIPLLLAALAVSGCSYLEDLSLDALPGFDGAMDEAACEERTVRWLEGIPFTDTPLLEMEIRRGEFKPVILRMTQNRTYVLRLRNRDPERHVFHAPEFFESIAVNAVALDNAIVETVCPGPAVELEPGQTFEMQFYAAVDGSYEFQDAAGVFGSLGAWESGGIVRIEPAP